MKISTKGRYALRLMMEFARQPEQVTRLKDAAAKQELSEKYLEQIVSVLSKAGFVKSIRGAQGGYLLTRAPESYSVGDILRLTEGNMAPVVCLGQDSVSCDLAGRCVSRSVFSRIEDAVNEVIETPKGTRQKSGAFFIATLSFSPCSLPWSSTPPLPVPRGISRRSRTSRRAQRAPPRCANR